MKRKYYMRGLGVGIVATCLIFMLGLFFLGVPMTDAAVKKRARALGMTDQTSASGDASSRTLKELQEEKEKKAGSDAEVKTTTTVDSDGTKTTVTEKKADPIEKKKDGKSSSNDPSSKDNKKDYKSSSVAKSSSSTKPSSSTKKAGKLESTASSNNTVPSESKSVAISIASGDTSFSVGKKLQNAGLVTSAKAFDDYLENNGYDHVIRAGTFKIRQGSSYREIAKAITGK